MHLQFANVSVKDESEVDVHKQLAIFSNYLKKHGLKITNQRLLVAEHIFGMKSHFTVDSLAEELKDQRDAISRATIYRIVSVLVDAGLLTEHNFSQNARYYEHIPTQSHHDHFLCLDCGRIDEFINEDIEKLQLEIARQHGFELADHNLNLYGRCMKIKQGEICEHMLKSQAEPEPRED